MESDKNKIDFLLLIKNIRSSNIDKIKSSYNKLITDCLGSGFPIYSLNQLIISKRKSEINKGDFSNEGWVDNSKRVIQENKPQILVKSKNPNKLKFTSIGIILIGVIIVLIYVINPIDNKNNTIEIKDQATWDVANSINTISAYESYKEKFPSGNYISQANILLDSLELKTPEKDSMAYAEAKSKNTIKSINRYINEYPFGNYINDAKEILKVLKVESDKQAFEEAKSKNTLKSIKGYISEYPIGKYIKDAKEILKFLKAESDRQAYEEAKSKNTIRSIKGYISEYPNGKYISDANEILKVIKAKSDRQAYEEAKSKNTIRSIKGYISEYPNGKYISDANEILKVLKAKSDRQAYEEAKSKYTLESVKIYIKGYPNGNYIKEAVALIDKLTYEQAMFEKTIKSLRAYLRTYPNGAYEIQAKQELTLLEKIAEQHNKIKKVSIEMIYVEGGVFQMGDSDGDSDEQPVHSVTLGDFYIGKYEITQKEWLEFMGPTSSNFTCNNCPVDFVSWEDTQKFINKLNKKTGLNFRLPSEAEWEYAARGGNQSEDYIYSGSDKIKNIAWYKENAASKIHPVGKKKANELGIYDMSGNLFEWCYDWYDLNYYKNSLVNNPTGSNSGKTRVARGGCFSSNAAFLRLTYRFNRSPESKNNAIGFRIVHSIK